ncbi:hypothetical protein AB0M32_09520 [Streptomyces sp. NPDC051985]|uniref:hypothetical protein n=1 Tax=Streptomyces sp. NPDC051985 TaxID=3155807 RepID=UPI003438315E
MAQGTPPPEPANPQPSPSSGAGVDWNSVLQTLLPVLLLGFGAVGTWVIRLPHEIRPVVLSVLALCAAVFYGVNFRADQAIRPNLTPEQAQAETDERSRMRRRSIIATSASLLGLVVLAVLWTVPSLNEQSSKKRDTSDAKSGAPLAESDLVKESDLLNYNYPPEKENVSRCFRVRLTGSMPHGYALWVVHQNNRQDAQGNDEPDPGAYYDLLKADPSEDSKAWQTEVIRVGSEKPSENGKYYWVSVYLVPPVTDALFQEIGGGNGVTLSSSPKEISDSIHAPAVRVKQVEIRRTSGTTC